jgi:aminopeptidase-like protein
MNVNKIYDFSKEIFPINRSITGSGVRETLNIIQLELPDLKIHTILTGEKCFDWYIPQEWNVNDAYIVDPNGKKICNFKNNNLHLMGYSIPINLTLNLEELDNHLHSLPAQPDAIPYITSYYNEEWGFCITHNQRKKLIEGVYSVVIDSTLSDGELNYGELLIKGDTEEEIFFSTYICHPSMGNNEVSGPSVVTYLSKYIENLRNRRYSYRIIFIPETIGSIAYLSKNLANMKQNVVAGFNVTCVGDDNNYSFMPSKNGSTLSDKVALHVLKNKQPNFKTFSFLERGSDERQYCSAGIDLPVCSVMRSKYREYDEYHTSLDDMSFISPSGLNGAYDIYRTIIDILEINYNYINTILCEPQLGRRGMYPNISTKSSNASVAVMMNFLTYCDGKLDLVDIAEIIQKPAWDLFELLKKLEDEGLIKRVQANEK